MIIHLRTRRRGFVSIAARVVGSFAVAVTMNFVAPADARAQNFEVLYYFSGAPDNGKWPVGPLIEAANGNFYGTTSTGGPADEGTIFRMTPDGQVTFLHAFTGDDGSGPGSALLQHGIFYGTTRYGSGPTNRGGTVFQMTPDGTLVALYSWPDGYTNSFWWPSALIWATDGNFYGTTSGNIYPPFNSAPVLYRVTPDGTYTVLHEFLGGPNDGQSPMAALIQASNGDLYTTTRHGGDPQGGLGDGTIFRITLGATFQVLHDFNGPQAATDGVNPEAPLVEGNDGNLYGTTSDGGPFGFGTVFRITLDGSFQVLHAFTDTEGIRCGLPGLIQATDGNFYGVGWGGNQPNDKIFQLTPEGTLTIVYTFPGTWEPSQLLQGSDGKLYGTARYGGVGAFPGAGAVFRLTLPGAGPTS